MTDRHSDPAMPRRAHCANCRAFTQHTPKDETTLKCTQCGRGRGLPASDIEDAATMVLDAVKRPAPTNGHGDPEAALRAMAAELEAERAANKDWAAQNAELRRAVTELEAKVAQLSGATAPAPAVEAEPAEKGEPYTVVIEREGCPHCKAGTVFAIEGPDGVCLSTMYGGRDGAEQYAEDRERAEDVAYDLNRAHELALELGAAAPKPEPST